MFEHVDVEAVKNFVPNKQQKTKLIKWNRLLVVDTKALVPEGHTMKWWQKATVEKIRAWWSLLQSIWYGTKGFVKATFK